MTDLCFDGQDPYYTRRKGKMHTHLKSKHPSVELGGSLPSPKQPATGLHILCHIRPIHTLTPYFLSPTKK